MGYTTQYRGFAKFNRDLTTDETDAVSRIVEGYADADKVAKDIGYAKLVDDEFEYVDLEWGEYGKTLVWNSAEKGSSLHTALRLVAHAINKISPDLHLIGEFMGQGESVGDFSIIRCDQNGVRIYQPRINMAASKEEFSPAAVFSIEHGQGTVLSCPCCGNKIYVRA